MEPGTWSALGDVGCRRLTERALLRPHGGHRVCINQASGLAAMKEFKSIRGEITASGSWLGPSGLSLRVRYLDSGNPEDRLSGKRTGLSQFYLNMSHLS